MRPPRLWLALPLALASLALPRAASAQVHADVGADVGGSMRIRSGGDDPTGYGGLVGLKGHVALFPLLRVGAYVDREVSSTNEPTARQYTSVGLRVKFTPPLGSEDLRAYAFAGAGYTGVYSKGYTKTISAPDVGGGQTYTGEAYGAGGGFVEVPVGIGGTWRFQKPWTLNAELSGRFGFGFGGSLYSPDGRPGQGPDATGTSVGPAGFGPVGNDPFALILTVGIGLDL